MKQLRIGYKGEIISWASFWVLFYLWLFWHHKSWIGLKPMEFVWWWWLWLESHFKWIEPKSNALEIHVNMNLLFKIKQNISLSFLAFLPTPFFHRIHVNQCDTFTLNNVLIKNQQKRQTKNEAKIREKKSNPIERVKTTTNPNVFLV